MKGRHGRGGAAARGLVRFAAGSAPARRSPRTTTRRRALSRGKSPVVRCTSLLRLASDQPAMYSHHPPRRRSSHERFLILLVESVFTPFSLSRGVGVPTPISDDYEFHAAGPGGNDEMF